MEGQENKEETDHIIYAAACCLVCICEHRAIPFHGCFNGRRTCPEVCWTERDIDGRFGCLPGEKALAASLRRAETTLLHAAACLLSIIKNIYISLYRDLDYLSNSSDNTSILWRDGTPCCNHMNVVNGTSHHMASGLSILTAFILHNLEIHSIIFHVFTEFQVAAGRRRSL